MPRNGSGTYSRAESDYVNATVIDETVVNSEMDDIATALTASIAKDGQTTTTAVIPFASGIKANTIAENTSGSGVTIDSVLLKDGGITLGTAGTITLEGATADAFETTITVTDPTADRTITLPDDTGTVALTSGVIASVVADTTPQLGGQLDVNGNAIGDGTLELLTFTEDASAVNHVNIENEATGGGPIISAAGDDTNVPLLLQGKGTGAVQIGDANLAFPDSDGTNGQALTTNGSGTLAFSSVAFPAPDFSGTGTVAADTKTDVAHGLGAKPTLVQVSLRCTTTDQGYAVGDEIVNYMGQNSSNSDVGAFIFVDTTNVSIVQGATLNVINKTTFNGGAIDVNDWEWLVKAWS